MADSKTNPGLGLYKEAGVDVAKGDRTVDWLKSDSQTADFPHGRILAGIGGFAGLFRPDFSGMDQPILVAANDGVGTKIDLAIDHNNLTGIGQDLVAMCVNDLYTIGATPMFFLDYYVTDALQEEQFKAVITGIKQGLKQANTALLGGETAEHPNSFPKGRFDLAGFVVGIVDQAKIIRPDEQVQDGDILIGFASSGFHSNGFSLIRKWVQERPIADETMEKILNPTKIYHELPSLIGAAAGDIHGVAHITGGGISGNLCRIIPATLSAKVDFDRVPSPDWMSRFIADNNSSRNEVESVFNLGLGMIMAVDKGQVASISQKASELGLQAIEIGSVTARSKDCGAVDFIH